MDIRVLRYFLVVAREESFSRAADALYLSQPTLSRQIREMEEELGVQLLTRTNRNVRLTQEGMRLRRRAQEIVDLMDKTKDEFAHQEDGISGDIFIGCGETQIMRQIARVMIPLQREHPGIRFHLYSANADEVTEKLDRGLLDFGLMIEPFNMKQYESIPLPDEDTFGFLLRRDHPLAQKAELTIEDVEHEPLIIPSQGSAVSVNLPADIFGLEPARANIVCQYNLLFNAAIMVEEGMGIALCLDRLADTSEHSSDNTEMKLDVLPLCTLPMTIPVSARVFSTFGFGHWLRILTALQKTSSIACSGIPPCSICRSTLLLNSPSILI